MWKIAIKFDFMDEELVYYFNSLNDASKELNISLYFLRQVYYRKHRNQFAKFFTITPVTRWEDCETEEEEEEPLEDIIVQR